MDRRTADGLLATAEAARTAEESDPGGRVEARYPEMVRALDWYVGAGEHEAARRLATALVPFWLATSRVDEGDAWFARFLATPRGGDAVRARASYDHGYLVFWAGRYELARQRFDDALALAEHLGDASLQALVLAGSARVALDSDAREAVRLLRRGLAVTDGLPDSDAGRASVLHVLGVALQMSGDLDGAREVMSARLVEARAAGDEFVIWVESANLSMVERRLGNLERAEELALDALRIDSARGDEMSIAWTVNGLAAVTAAQGDHARAATLTAWAAAVLARAGGEWPPDEREQYDETVAAVSSALPASDLEAAQAEGAAMSLADVLAFALSSRD